MLPTNVLVLAVIEILTIGYAPLFRCLRLAHGTLVDEMAGDGKFKQVVLTTCEIFILLIGVDGI